MRTYRNIACLLFLLTLNVLAQNRSATGGTGAWGGVAGLQTANSRLVITTQNLLDATSGSAYSQTLTAVNGTAPLNWTIMLGSLPPGMTLNSSTGVISGTSSVPGNYPFTVFVVDSTTPTAKTATQDLSIAVGCVALQILSTSPLPSALINTAYSYQFLGQGGNGTVTWAITSGALQTGLSLSSSGLLSGTPTAASSVTLGVTATDSCPLVAQTRTGSFVLNVTSPVVINTNTTLPAGVAGVAYSTQLSASGGTAPYTWTRTSGVLPVGITLTTGGLLAGTPTTAGTYTFTIRAQDTLGVNTSSIFTLVISCGTLSITTTTLPPGTQNSPYSQQLASSGGSGAVTWSLLSGTWPNGIMLSPAGVISGTPTQAGTFSPTVQAADSCSTQQTASQALTLTVNSVLTINTATALPDATEGTAYTTQMSASGGVPPYTWTTPAGPVPNGAIDLMDYFIPASRATSHLTGATNKSTVLNAGMFWMLKGASGNPWDGWFYDDTYVYFGFTENNDASQQAACIAAGYTSCFVDPFAYKFSTPGKLFTPRYFVPGTTVTLLSPPVLTAGNVNAYQRTTNCGVDAQPILYLGNVKTVTSGPTNVSYGGDVGTQQTIEIDYYYSAGIDGIYHSRERFYLALGYGQVKWTFGTRQADGSYLDSQTSLNNNVVAGGAPTPNFACKVPTLPITGGLPAGVTKTSGPSLDMNSFTGVISGTPAVSGTNTMTIQVEDSVGTIAQGNFTLSVTCPALSITSTSPLPKATQGQAYSFQLSAGGGVLPITWTTSGPLPAGLTLTTAGLISGTPTATGVFLFSVQAKDSCAPSPQSQLKIVSLSVAANSGPLAISTTSPLQVATEGTAYSQQMAATGGTTPYTWAVTSGSLPAGLSMTSAGVISGTPTTTGTSTPTIRVTDALSTTASGAFSITVSCPALTMISTTPLPTGTQNTAYSLQFQASGGITPYTWSLTAGSFPTGLSLSSGGALTGTPTVAGTSSPTVRVADSCVATPQTVSRAFTVTVNPVVVPVVINTTSPLPAGVVGTTYSTTMSATGGTQPYFWSVISGAMPGGLTLNANGTITGTPTTSGVFTPTIQVTDSLGASTSGVFSLTVTCTTLALSSSTTLPQGTNGSPYSFQFTNTGGVSPFTWTKTSGTFPSGLSLTAGGLLSGTPGASGTFSPVIQVADSCSTPQTASNTFTLVVQPAIVPLSIVTTSPLPSGTQSVAYSSTMTATGGTAPYTWAVTVGTLPTGLSLSAAGVISGTPSGTGTSTVTIRVTDSAAATSSGSFSITINAATAADNRYCTTSETWIGPTTDGPATLPNKCVRTALSDTLSPGATVTVTAGSFSDLQAKVTAAICGRTIVVPALNGTAQAVYSGQLIFPATACPAGQWITVTTDKTANLPAEGSRITPAWTGKGSLPARPSYSQPSSPGTYLPLLINSGPVITFTAGAARWRLIGLEVTSTATSNQVSLINEAGVNHVINDRLVCHGGNNATWQAKNNSTRCVSYGGSTYVATIDSYMGDIHTAGGDTQPIYLGGTTTTPTGPIKVVNNFLEGAGMCIFSGGGGNGTATLPVTDVEIRRNHCFKPVFWKSNDPTFFGTTFTVKNHIEFKNTQRALIEANFLDTVWGYQSDQFGAAINLGPKNQSVAVFSTVSVATNGSITRISGTAFPSNVMSPLCAVPLHCRVKINGISYQAQTWVDASHMTVAPAPPTSASVSATVFSPGLNPSAIITDITIRYNKISHASRAIGLSSDFSDGGDVGLGHFRDSIHDNIADDIDGFHWSLGAGGCCAWSLSLTPVDFVLAPFNLTDLSYVHNTFIPSLSGSAAGFGPSIFNGRANSPMTNLNIRDNVSAGGVFLPTTTHVHSNALSDLQAGAPGTFCFEGNVMAVSTATSGAVTGTANNPPYPAAGQSPGCPSGIGNFSPATYNAIGFTNLNGANGGNYQLLNTSPYHNAASDGTDPGANIPLVNQYTAGVP